MLSRRARTEHLTRLDFHQLDCGLAGRYRTAAFRCVQTVGVPLDPSEGIFMTTTIRISGLYHAACLLTTPGSVHPLTMVHAGSFLTCWLGFDQVGLELIAFSPTG